MTTALTPPPLPPTAGPGRPVGQAPAGPGTPAGARGPGGPRTSARVIAIVAIVLGVLLIVGAITSGAVSAVRAAVQRSETLTTDARGIRALDIDIAAADLTIVYEGDEVRLDVTGSADDWRLTRDEDAVRVTTERGWWGGWRLFGESDVATLTLPRALEDTPVDADLSLSAGVLRAGGSYGALDVDLAAGSIDLVGTARSLDVDVSAGRLAFELADVGEADLRLRAGAVTGAVTGRAPVEVAIDVSAGRLDLTLPDDAYAVSTDVSAGQLDNRLDVASSSANRVTVSVSAGYVALRS